MLILAAGTAVQKIDVPSDAKLLSVLGLTHVSCAGSRE